MKTTCDVITAVQFEGEADCVNMTCDFIRAVLFEGKPGCVKMTIDVKQLCCLKDSLAV